MTWYTTCNVGFTSYIYSHWLSWAGIGDCMDWTTKRCFFTFLQRDEILAAFLLTKPVAKIWNKHVLTSDMCTQTAHERTSSWVLATRLSLGNGLQVNHLLLLLMACNATPNNWIWSCACNFHWITLGCFCQWNYEWEACEVYLRDSLCNESHLSGIHCIEIN